MASDDRCPYCGEPVSLGPGVQRITWGAASLQFRRAHKACHRRDLARIRDEARQRWPEVRR